MKIIIDGFGGDNSPEAVVEGAVKAVENYDVEIIITGDEEKINKVFKDKNLSKKNITIKDTKIIVDMHDEAKVIIRDKKDSSMGLGLQMLANGEGDAFVSAGSTAALVFGSSAILKRIKGVKRASLAAVIPTLKSFYMLLDSGANVECRPEMLRSFGIMGSVYMEKIMNVASPRVALLNNGVEETKGRELELESYKLLKDTDDINFIGNIEARQVPLGDCDVLVTDGFSGNILLKTTEGMGKFMASSLSDLFKANFVSKIGALCTLKGIKALKEKMNYKNVGGAPLLGVRKPVIKAHGSSDATAFMNAIRQANEFAKNDVIGKITESLEGMATDDE